jgi:hypothetical protein
MKLRSYQQECIEAIQHKGAGRYLCCLATGMGKTVIFANIPRQGNTLILSHRQELVMQPLRYFDCSTAVEMGESSASRLGHPVAEVTSASIQTLARRFAAYDKDAFHTIIVDEAHHAASASYRAVLDYFTPERLLGFTATPNRSDGAGLESVFDEIIFKRDLRYGIENGYLSPIHCRRVNIGYDLRGVAVRMGDYSPGELERAVNIDKCNQAIAEIVANIAELPALIFAVDVAHAQAIAEYIPGAVALSAASKDRHEVVAKFKNGEIPVLVNCSLFTEGTDLPNTRTVIIARPTKSVGLYTQMVGRGTRLAPGKDHCLLIDCVGASNMPLCTAPTLLGLDLDGVPAKYQVEIEGDLLADIPAIIEQKTDTPASWINNVRVVNIWAKANGYTLHDVNYQRKPDGTLFVRLPVEGSRRNALLSISAPDLRGNSVISTSGGYAEEMPAQEAYDWAFAILRQRFANCRPLWSLQSAKRWGKDPANEKQIRYIRQLAKRKGVDVSDVMENLTKLQATSLIENLK